MARWRIAAALAGAAAYAVVSHVLMVRAADAPWAVAVLLAPLLLTGAGFAWRRRDLPALAAAALGAAGLVWIVLHGGIAHLALAQHAGIHLALAAVFGSSLRTGREPLITQVARRVHGAMPPAMASYTRRVTLLWTGYFVGMAALSAAVFAFAPWSAWSLLANVLTPVAITLLFVGEHLARYRLHPEFERASLADAVRAYAR